MKKIAITGILVIAGFLLFSCFKNSDAKDNTVVNSVANTEVKAAEIEHLTNETFKKKVFDYDKNKEWKFEGNTPAIIDFYADWCRPCKMAAPILEELNKEYDGKIKVYKVNTQTEQELSMVFGIQGIPAFLFIPLNGQPQMSTGYMEKQDFEKIINEILKVKK